uniref:Clusterin-like 1 (Retinal) n=1 Tax=Nothobranchius kuhntae TaxID=321403 RepID=A0A1A8I235_NOTKU
MKLLLSLVLMVARTSILSSAAADQVEVISEDTLKQLSEDEWEECRPCLEDACKTFYTSTCRRGFASFSSKVENFFQRVSLRFGPREPPMAPGDILVNQDESLDDSETDVVQIEDSFNRVTSKVGLLVNRSISLASKMSNQLNKVLQRAFLNITNVPIEETTSEPFYPARDSGFLEGVGLEGVLESFFDTGKRVVEEFGAVVTQVFDDLHQAVKEKKQKEKATFSHFLQNRKLCRDLRRQTSECWQLQDKWSHDEPNMSATQTRVEVTVLNSPPLILTLPGELDLQDPAFIHYITQEALEKYKEMVQTEDN